MTDHSEDIIFKKRIEAYYRGERVSNATLVVAGVIAIIWTSFLFYWRQGHLSGAFFYSARLRSNRRIGLFSIPRPNQITKHRGAEGQAISESTVSTGLRL